MDFALLDSLLILFILNSRKARLPLYRSPLHSSSFDSALYEYFLMRCCRILSLKLIVLVFAEATSAFLFQPIATRSLEPKRCCRVFEGKRKHDTVTNKEPNPLTKASWYVAEAFGRVLGRREKEQETTGAESGGFDRTRPPASRKETLLRLREDNDREYFLSGQVDSLIYDPDCEFADPFVSFRGRDRFVENLANLGSFISKYSARPLKYEQISDTEVETKFMVKLELNLPWKPILAWPWGVICKVDPRTNLIVLHKESWDIDPWEGVKQVFRRPSTRVL